MHCVILRSLVCFVLLSGSLGLTGTGPLAASPQASGSCAPRGTWPGPSGAHYLNQFNDGKCGYYVDVHYVGTLSMDSGTWYQQDVININQGAKVTVASNVTLVDNFYVQPNHAGGYININGTLDFEAGSRLQVQCTQCGIFVSWLSAGTLTVNGTLAAPVTMSGTGPGSWMGIAFRAAGAAPATGHVTNLLLSGGGGHDPSYGSVNAGIYITHSSPTISTSTIDSSVGNGIEVDSGTSTPVLSGDTLSNNTGYGIQYDFLTTTLTNITGVTMRGNGHNAVRMMTATATQYTTNVTWPNLRYPIIDDVFTTVLHGGHLTLAPGTTVEFGKQSAFQVVSGGVLTMNGAKVTPITLTSEATTPAPGDWPGAELEGGGAASLSYVHVSYAGAQMPGLPAHTSILATGSISPTITSTVVDHSAGNDMEVSSGAKPVLHGDSFLAVPTGKFAVVNDGWSNGQPLVDATTSWWGDPTGPFNARSNPGGKGTPASDGVSIAPWLTSAPPL